LPVRRRLTTCPTRRSRIFKYLYGIAAGSALLSLAAAEHHGQVQFNGLPVPGATITAVQGDKVQGDKRLVAITDPQGDYAFPNLADGLWNIEVEMLGFVPQNRKWRWRRARLTRSGN